MGHDRRFLAAAVGTLAFLVAFAVAAVVPLPRLWYFPIDGRWVVARAAAGVAMDFYGRVLIAVAAGAVGFGAGWVWPRRQPLSAEAVRLLAGWTALAVLFTAGLFIATLSVRTIVPALPLVP